MTKFRDRTPGRKYSILERIPSLEAGEFPKFLCFKLRREAMRKNPDKETVRILYSLIKEIEERKNGYIREN